jgi:tRNA dimethylallyltransferase
LFRKRAKLKVYPHNHTEKHNSVVDESELKPRLVAIVGPTGVGKSQLALHLARDIDGEIVSADSRQVYRYMDIGTAKPTIDEQAVVSHHLIDIIEPDKDFSLAEYQQLAGDAITDIQYRNKLPLLVGGTGQYVKAVLEGWEIPRVVPDMDFRQKLEEQAANGQTEELYKELTSIDPEAAQKIDPRNIRRVIRALEVSKSSGIPFSQLQKKRKPSFESIIIGLTARRDELYCRIDTRVDKMIDMGLVDEVRKLINTGYRPDLPSMSGIGYRQICAYINGEMSLMAAVESIKFETHRFVRHQYNWFRLNDDKILWFDIDNKGVEEEIKTEVKRFSREL